MKNIFITADTHFGHENIIEYEDRPFEDILKHNIALVSNWNSAVSIYDEVFMLGDFAFKDCDSIEFLLNGKIHLIKGNHDSSTETIIQSITIKKYGMEFTLCHYPSFSEGKEGIFLCGHSHSGMEYIVEDKSKKLVMNVGVDVSDTFPNTKKYHPINLKDVVTKAKTILGGVR